MTQKDTKENIRSKPNDKAPMNKKLLIILGVTLAVIVLIWGTVFATMQLTNDDTPQPQPEPVQSVSHGPSGKTAEEDKKDVVAATTAMLVEAGKSPTKDNVATRMEKLDNDDTTVVTKELVDMMRFAPQTENGVKVTTYQTLITVNAILTNNGKDQIAPKDPASVNSKVFMDSDLGIAYVPLSLYAGDGAAFNFQMVYVDGDWKLFPYSLVEAVGLSALAQQQGSGQPAPSPSK